jgi:hypothetical protein
MKWDIPGLCTIGTPHEGFSVAVHTDFEWPSADGFNLILSFIGFYKPLSRILTTNRYSRYRESVHGSEVDVDLLGKRENNDINLCTEKNETKTCD